MKNLEYQLYHRCKNCGQVLTDLEIDDNDGYCDFCYTQNNGFVDYIGEE